MTDARQLRRDALAAAVLATAALAGAVHAAGAATYGEGVSLKETTPLTAVLEQPAAYEGRTVAVEGVVTAVCSEMGCWMALAPDGTSAKALLIQVEHGVVVFPMSAKGKRATAQGIVQRNGRHGQAAAREHAEHRGDAEPQAVGGWQIKATGALVH
jgi:hypothetical protein